MSDVLARLARQIHAFRVGGVDPVSRVGVRDRGDHHDARGALVSRARREGLQQQVGQQERGVEVGLPARLEVVLRLHQRVLGRLRDPSVVDC